MKRLILLFVFVLSAFFGTSADAATLKSPPSVSSGLVGWWTFDGTDTVTGVMADRSGKGNVGSFNNIASSTFYVKGKIGQGSQYDGSNDYVSITNESFFDPYLESNVPFTYAAWVKSNRASSNFIVAKELNSGTFRGAYMVVDGSAGGGLSFIMQNSGTSAYSQVRSTTSVNDGQWHHVVAVSTGTGTAAGMNLYIDGALAAKTTVNDTLSGGTITNDSPVTIGSRQSGGVPFLGQIDDVRIYSRALTAQEITQLYRTGEAKIAASRSPGSLSSGLVGHWTFDGTDVATGKMVDRSGNANTGTFSGIASSTFYSLGKIGQAGNFDGSNDRVDIADASSIRINGSLTVSAWVYMSSKGTYRPFVEKRQSDSNGNLEYLLRYTSSGDFSASDHFQFLVNNGAGGFQAVNATSAGSPSVGRWYFIVGRYDATADTVSIQVDNGTVDTTSAPATPNTSTYTLSLGAGGTANVAGRIMHGKIDDARVYNRALSTAEVALLYNSGVDSKVNASTNTKVSSGLVGLWSFDGKDISNGVLLDRSGNGYGLIPSGISTSTFYAIGRIGQGVRFDGVNDYISGSGSNLALGTGNFTLSLWVLPRTFSAEASYFDSLAIGGAGARNNAFTLVQSASTGRLRMFTVGTYTAASAGNPTLNQWNHVAIVRSGTIVTYYINGVADATTASLSTNITSTSAVFGRYSDTASGLYSGSMDDARVYNRALSASEIRQLYSIGR